MTDLVQTWCRLGADLVLELKHIAVKRFENNIFAMMKSILLNSRKHDISFHSNGKIDISAHIARRLNLRSGDVIDIAYEDGEFYLYVKLRAGMYSGRHNGRVWSTAGSKGTFRTWSKTLASVILEAAGAQPALRCPCGEEVERNNNLYITVIYRCQL